MGTIHLIKKTNGGLPGIDPVRGEPGIWTSGYWTLSEAKARSLIGGRIYFHERQCDASYFGGEVLDAQRIEGGEKRGNILFHFRFLPECKGVRTDASGWSQEMKLRPDGAAEEC